MFRCAMKIAHKITTKKNKLKTYTIHRFRDVSTQNNDYDMKLNMICN